MQAFAAHGREESSGGRYRLYAEFLGDAATGPTEVRFVVVDGAGGIVLVDRQTPEDAAFRRTAGRDPDPLGCATLVRERLFALASWQQAPGSVRDGAFAARWQRQSGAPDAAERRRMSERLAAVRRDLADARFVVLPPAGAIAEDGAAERLAGAMPSRIGVAAARAAGGAGPAVPPSSNQQQRLWSLARAASARAAAVASGAEYVLATDYALADDGRAGFLDLVVVTSTGEVVIADYQNDQHDSWRAAAPHARDELEGLVLRRLRALLRD